MPDGVLQWLNLLNLLLLPILIYVVRLEHRLTVVEQYEGRLAMMESEVFERRKGARQGGN